MAGALPCWERSRSPRGSRSTSPGGPSPTPASTSTASCWDQGCSWSSVLVLSGAALAAVRSSRRATVEDEAAEARLGAGLVGIASRAGLSPTVSNGVRMAFHRGHGRSAVPVRSAIVGGVFGVLGVTAGLVFAASLQSVIDAPQRYGWTWDVTTEDQVVNTPCGGDTRGVEQLPGVEAVAELCYGPGLQVDGRTVPSMAFRPLLGTLEPEVVEGRGAERARRDRPRGRDPGRPGQGASGTP